jgi:hypothetical protein
MCCLVRKLFVVLGSEEQSCSFHAPLHSRDMPIHWQALRHLLEGKEMLGLLCQTE